MTNKAPFKIYLSFTGYYPTTPNYDSLGNPIVTDENYTEIEVYNNNLTLHREMKSIFYSKIERYNLTGDFTLINENYELIKTARESFNELLMKVEILNSSGVYVKKWGGTVALRGIFDDDKKTITLSNFETIDKYTDLLNNLNNSWKLEDYKTTDNLTILNPSGSDFALHQMTNLENISYGIVSQQYSPRIYSEIDYNNVLGSFSTYSQGHLIMGECIPTQHSPQTYPNSGLEIDLEFLFKMFWELFHVCITLEPIKKSGIIYNQIKLHKIQDIIYPSSGVEHDYSDIIFNKYNYIMESVPKNSIYFFNKSLENMTYGRYQNIIDYQINSKINIEFDYHNLQFVPRSWITFSNLDDYLDKKDYFLFVAHRDSAGNMWVEAGEPCYGADPQPAFRTMAPYIITNELLDWQPVDKGSVTGVYPNPTFNPNVKQFSIIIDNNYMKIQDAIELNFADYFKTKLIDKMKIKNIEYSLKENSCKITLEG